MKRYSAYPEYKPSGIDWLGDIPKHWNVSSLRYCFSIIAGATPQSSCEEYWNGDICWVTPADLSQINSLYISDSCRTISTAGLNSCGTTLVPAGSIILSTRAPIGTVAINTREMCHNQGCKSLIPHKNIDPLYYAYFLVISTTVLNILGKGTTFLELSRDELSAVSIPLPPLPEQQAIAMFLDRETAKIDGVIGKREKLIELLQEKRSALISHAVTKGLDPEVKLKPPGIDWLGDIPEHWKVMKLKWSLRCIHSGDGISPDEIESEGPFPVYGGNGIMGYANQFNASGENLIIGRVGAKCGNVYFKSGEKWISDNALWLEPSISLNKKFLAMFLRFLDLNLQANQNAQPLITGTIVGNQFICIPSSVDQQAITDYLDRETAKIDSLIEKEQAIIGKLKEYRLALISEAVTGKIDVGGGRNG